MSRKSDAALPRAAIVYHPARVNRARLRAVVAKREAADGWAESLWLATGAQRATEDLVADAIAAGVALVIAAGGDGTVREVGTAMRAYDVPFGIIPVGTANLLARNLRLPLANLAAAAAIAFTGDDRRIDLGVVDYRLDDGSSGLLRYLVIAGFGVDADMVAGADPESKRRFGWLAYVWPILRSLRRTQRTTASYSLDGRTPITSRLHTLLVGNAGVLTAGLRMLPEAELDDGVFDVLAIRSVVGRDRLKFIRWLRAYQPAGLLTPAARSSRKSSGAPGSAFHYAKAREVTVTMDPPAVAQADGDLIGDVRWAHFRVEALAVAVRVARGAAG